MGFLKDLGNSLLGGIPSMIGNAVGAISNNSTNKANKEINQMNNEFNERMMDKQIAYEKEMWEKNNEYNSASSQAQRWREAGFNPTMMMGNANAGVATSGSVGAASAAPAAPQQAFRPDFSGVTNSLLAFQERKRQEKVDAAAINEMDANADAARARASADVAEAFERTKNWKIKNKFAEQVEDLNIQQMSADIKTSYAAEDYYKTLSTLNVQESLLKSKELAIFDEKSRLELSSISADIALKYSQGQLTKAQAQHELSKQLKTIAETTGIKLSNNNLASMSGSLIEKAKQEAIRSGQPQNIWQGFNDAYEGFNNFVDDNLIKPSKRAWKDTKRYLRW